MDKVQLMALADEAAKVLGTNRTGAIQYALQSIIEKVKQNEERDGIQATKVLDAAGHLIGTQGSFTMDELVDVMFGDEPVFSPHRLKIFSAKILKASGFKRKQRRRGPLRPLIWFRPLKIIDLEKTEISVGPANLHGRGDTP